MLLIILNSRQEEPSLQWKPGGLLGLQEAGFMKMTPTAAVRTVQRASTAEVFPGHSQKQQRALGGRLCTGYGRAERGEGAGALRAVDTRSIPQLLLHSSADPGHLLTLTHPFLGLWDDG